MALTVILAPSARAAEQAAEINGAEEWLHLTSWSTDQLHGRNVARVWYVEGWLRTSRLTVADLDELRTHLTVGCIEEDVTLPHPAPVIGFSVDPSTYAHEVALEAVAQVIRRSRWQWRLWYWLRARFSRTSGRRRDGWIRP